MYAFYDSLRFPVDFLLNLLGNLVYIFSTTTSDVFSCLYHSLWISKNFENSSLRTMLSKQVIGGGMCSHLYFVAL